MSGTMEDKERRDLEEEARKTDDPSERSYDEDMETVISSRDDLTELQKNILYVDVDVRHAKYSEVHEECKNRGIDVSYKTVWTVLSQETPRNSNSTSGETV